jgi:acyl-CoA synthetase (AMP-forming)/AMP-acid ligase II
MPYHPEITTLAEITRFHRQHVPDRAAIMFEDVGTSYAELDDRASQVANGLIAEGIPAQSRIAYLGKNSVAYFELFLGCTKANCAIVGVNWRLAAPEVEYIANDAEATVFFVDEEFFPILDKIGGQLKTVRKIIKLSGSRDGWDDYATWRDSQSTDDPMLPIEAEDVAVQMYTSGTTGNPKGVQMTHRGFLALMEDYPSAGDWNHWGDNEVALIPMPVFHIGGTGWAFQSLYNGATGVVMVLPDPGTTLEFIDKYRVTKMFVVPAVLQFMLADERVGKVDVSSIEVIFYGASPIPEDVLVRSMKMFPGAGFVQLYGMTEANGSVTYLPPEEHVVGSERLKSCGKPFEGCDIKIVDGDDNELPAREVGEIVVASKSLMKGYWKLPEATAKAVKGDWYYSGDAGYLDEGGYLYIHDRVKDMIVSGAENIYPAEVESALSLHEAVADVAVIGVPSEKWGEEVKALIVKAPGTDPTPEELIAFSREHIAGFKVPKSIDFVEELPRNPSGKILKRELRAPFWEGHDSQVV